MSEVKLYCGDCLEIMKQIPDGSVDAVVTDPPYGQDSDFAMVKRAISEARRISRMQVVILDWRNPLSLADGKFAELVWEYGWVSGGRTKSSHYYPTHNTIHFLGDNLFHFDTKSGSIIKRRPGFSSPRQCSYARKTGHKYEKPLALMEYLAERIDGATVLDPFMGSGTTGVACVKTGRNFIGIEISEEYYNVACKRIADAQAQLTLETIA